MQERLHVGRNETWFYRVGGHCRQHARANAADVQEGFPFMNNVPDPLLSGKELPTFKFALEKSEGKVIGGSYGKEATSRNCPSRRESPASR